jgi:hypothetical protein
MARFGLMILNNGNWNGTQVMTDTTYFNAMINTSQNLNESYGYLWWLNGKSSFMLPGFQFLFPGSLNPNGPADLIMALGKNGQMLNVVPSQNLIYVRMGDAPGVGEVPITFNDSIWSILNQLMCSSTGINGYAELPSFDIYPNPAKENVQISGIQSGDMVTVLNTSGQLLTDKQSTGQTMFISTNSFDAGIYFVLVRNQKGGSAVKKISVIR